MAAVDVRTRECDGHVVVALRGELDMADAVNVAAALAVVARRVPQIIVDLAGLRFIDSSGVAALARGRNLARHTGGELLLAAPQQQVLRVLTLTRLIDVFLVHASVEDAADSFTRSPQMAALPTPSRRLAMVNWPRAALRTGVRALGRERPGVTLAETSSGPATEAVNVDLDRGAGRLGGLPGTRRFRRLLGTHNIQHFQ